MKVAIAIDSFKGSLSSLQAGNAAAQGIHRVDPDVKTVVRTLADGGEGTVQALTEGLGGQFVSVPVTGPAQKTVSCTYGVIEQAQTAVIEMSGAAGITLVSDTERNPLYTTTYGVGEVIQDAVLRGCRHFIIGIGGSATNDGGIGMLQALGFGLLDAEGKQVPFGAVGLEALTAITTDHVLPELSECTFRIACDVTNPLCGSNGCSAVFGPQKGADADMIARMDSALASYASLCQKQFPKADPAAPGTGAAGGLGFAFQTFLPAVLEPGIQIVLDEIRLRDDVRDADLIITGEGRLDGQTTDETRHMFDAAAFRRMKKNSFIVNVSRGALIDTYALADAIRIGDLQGAGLDTHESEPLALDHPLRTIDSVILTPHSAHYSSKAFETLRMHMVDQAIAVLEGTMPQFLFNREQLGL